MLECSSSLKPSTCSTLARLEVGEGVGGDELEGVA
jgi:hypothetical protein